MAKYNVTINGVEAETPQQAQQVADALTEIKNRLSNPDLLELAALLREHPGIVQKAKTYKNFLK